MNNYTNKLKSEAKAVFEPYFGRELTDDETCQALHQLAAIVRIVHTGGADA